MQEKSFINLQLGIKFKSYIDHKCRVWFKAKEVATILGYQDTDQAIRKHVDDEDRKYFPVETTGYSKRGRPPIFVNESGLYSLVLSSKLETAKKFKRWLLLRFLDIVNHEMLLRDMYLITIKCLNCIGALKQGVNKMAPGALKQGVNKMAPGVAKHLLNKMLILV